jgi:hypothetical protein
MSDPEVTSVDPTVLIDRASQGKAQPAARPGSQSPAAKSSEVVSVVQRNSSIEQVGQPSLNLSATVLVQHEQVPRRPAPAHRPAPAYATRRTRSPSIRRS